MPHEKKWQDGKRKFDKDLERLSRSGLQIQPIEFESPYWLEHFLQSLFQLKPALKTSVTYDKFRIVIEFFSGGLGDQRFEQSESAVEEVIDYLREEGCKVPVLIYSDIKLTQSMY